MKDFLSGKVLQIILRLIIGGVFLYASIDKLFNPEDFAKAIKAYDILPLSLVNVLAIVLPYIEFVTGIFLIFGVYKKGSSAVISLILVIFIIALTRAYALGLDINCGCFSLESEGSNSDILIRIIEDVLLLAGTLIVFIFSDKQKKQENNIISEGAQNE